MRDVLKISGAVVLFAVAIVLLVVGSSLQSFLFLIYAVVGFVILMTKKTGRLKWMIIGLCAGILFSSGFRRKFLGVCLPRPIPACLP
jgi:hypothetical protein